MEENNLSIMEFSLESNNISLEHSLYPLFFKQHGIYRLPQLQNPNISDKSKTDIPKNSIIHWCSPSDHVIGPSENLIYLRGYKGNTYIEHITELSPGHKAIRKPSPVQAIKAKYRMTHRSLRPVKDVTKLNGLPNALVIYNYGMIPLQYKYRPHRFNIYYKFDDFFKTIVDNINELAKITSRHQFMEIHLPSVLYPKMLLNNFSKEFPKGLTNKFLAHFKEDIDLVFFHFWLYTTRFRELSLFNKLSDKAIENLNLIITEGNNYTVLNLKLIKNWLDENNDIEIETDESGEEMNQNIAVQNYIYKFFEKMISLRTGAGTTIVEEPISETVNEKDLNLSDAEYAEKNNIDKKEVENVDNDDDSISEVNQPLDQKELNKEKTEEKEADEQDIEEKVLGDAETTDGEIAESKPIKKEEIEKQTYVIDDFDDVDEAKDMPYVSETITDEHTDYILQETARQVEAGNLTANQYNRIEKLVNQFKEKPSPYNPDMTIQQYMEIPTSLTDDFKGEKVPDNDWIIDKSMLNVTTESMDKQYIKEVLNRNITQSIMGLQKGGIIVTGMEVNEFVDAANEYQVMSVDVQTLEGQKSTLKLKLPLMREDGTFLSNGVTYTLRKMRVDKPIRKVDNSKVALTSYYGKLNVIKSEKKKYNLEQALHRLLQVKVFDETITHVQYGTQYDDTNEKFSAVYSMIATKFKRFNYKYKGRELLCVFDYKERTSLIDPDDKKALATLTKLEEKTKGVLFAVDPKTKTYYLLNNKHNAVICSDMAKEPPVSFIEFFDIPNAPVEYAEVKISGKSIPIGMILLYYMGMSKLLKLLNVQPRKAYRGAQLALHPNEYTIKFNDEVWIFNRKDYKAQLILAGLRAYEKYFTDYSAALLDNPDTYMAILRESGIRPIIENEFNYLRKLFIDDITKSLLQQMHEPTDFINLLIRAAELLTTMKYSKEINMDDMFIRSHQRIAGHVYKSLMQQLKAFGASNIRSKVRFDVKPTEIFEAIRKDPSVTLVDDINPIHNLKEHDNVTFSGDGGRGIRSMVGRTRSFDKTDLGTISEATVDSAHVAVTTFLSGSPNFTSLYGITDRVEPEAKNAGKILSTASLLAPGITQDDQFGSSIVVIRW